MTLVDFRDVMASGRALSRTPLSAYPSPAPADVTLDALSAPFVARDGTTYAALFGSDAQPARAADGWPNGARREFIEACRYARTVVLVGGALLLLGVVLVVLGVFVHLAVLFDAAPSW